jgi:hypothetical protein
MLIQRGASLKAVDNNGVTVLHCTPPKNRVRGRGACGAGCRSRAGLPAWLKSQQKEEQTPPQKVEVLTWRSWRL